jgi:chromosome segregation ATPase
MADNQSEVRQQYEAELAASKAAYSEAQNKINEADAARSRLIMEEKSAQSRASYTETMLGRTKNDVTNLQNQINQLIQQGNAAPAGSEQRQLLLSQASEKTDELAGRQRRVAKLEQDNTTAQAAVTDVQNKLQDTRTTIGQNNDIARNELQKTNEIQ